MTQEERMKRTFFIAYENGRQDCEFLILSGNRIFSYFRCTSEEIGQLKETVDALLKNWEE